MIRIVYRHAIAPVVNVIEQSVCSITNLLKGINRYVTQLIRIISIGIGCGFTDQYAIQYHFYYNALHIGQPPDLAD